MKIRTSILCLIFLLFCNETLSQSFLPEFNLKKDSLTKMDSELILDYHLSFGGMFIPEIDEECSEYEPRYLFWILNNKYFKQKFTECKVYSEIELNHSDLLSTILNNLNVIKNAEILPAQSNEITSIMVVHDDFWNFNIYSKEFSFTKSISRFDLETKEINEGEKNINYYSNQKSILNKLIKLAQKEEY